MKKIILSITVIISFVLYSVFMRHSSVSTVVSAQPQHTTTAPASSTPANNSVTPQAPSTSPPSQTYRDGTFVGDAADAFYGNIQVEVIIQAGKLTDVQFLQSPNDQPTSVMINQQAMPLLKQEAIAAQSAQVDGVTGATDTSQAFVQSLSSALAKAQSA